MTSATNPPSGLSTGAIIAIIVVVVVVVVAIIVVIFIVSKKKGKKQAKDTPMKIAAENNAQYH